MKGKVSKRTVDALKPSKSGDVFLWDTELRGFGARCMPSGAKSFVIAYYAPGLNNVRRRMTLGAFGPLTADDARDKASALLTEVTNEKDPAKEKADGRKAAKEETVSKLFEGYLDYGRAHFKERTIDSYEGLARLYVMPAIGKLPVAKVATQDIARLHLGLKDKPGTANRCIQMVKAFFYWLERGGLFTGTNPARNVTMYAENPRERFLTVEEMARVGQALRVAEQVGIPSAPEHKREPGAKRTRNPGMFKSELQPASPVIVAALRFLTLTGWRESEAVRLQWSEVNLDTGIATLGDTKTGKSVRAITAPALELLAAQPHTEGSPYVFPGRDPKKPLESVRHLWSAVRIEAKLEGVRLHDLRHSVASFAGAQGYSLFLIGKLLGHKTARSTERYAHLADDARRVMADDVGKTIRDAMAAEPKAAQLAKPVIPLHATRA
jgi:integrase